MNWLQVTINTKHERLDLLCRQLEDLGVEGLIINDESAVNDFLENEKKYWDYVDDSVLEAVRGVCSVQFYLSDSQEGENQLKLIGLCTGESDITVDHVRDEDWENNWREFYKPIETGSRLVIVPEWESVPDSDRLPLRLDPGLIFGTGSHATTRMCLESLENYSPSRVLDLGCGSGILAIAALILGADEAIGCDIDDKAPHIAMENGALNGFGEDKMKIYAGDILSDKALQKKLKGQKYQVVLANIVADVILALAPAVPDYLDKNGVFICSGIIDGRENEVYNGLCDAGFRVTDHKHIDNWHCFTAHIAD